MPLGLTNYLTSQPEPYVAFAFYVYAIMSVDFKSTSFPDTKLYFLLWVFKKISFLCLEVYFFREAESCSLWPGLPLCGGFLEKLFSWPDLRSEPCFCDLCSLNICFGSYTFDELVCVYV